MIFRLLRLFKLNFSQGPHLNLFQEEVRQSQSRQILSTKQLRSALISANIGNSYTDVRKILGLSHKTQQLLTKYFCHFRKFKRMITEISKILTAEKTIQIEQLNFRNVMVKFAAD